jgi:hypothetical protein
MVDALRYQGQCGGVKFWQMVKRRYIRPIHRQQGLDKSLIAPGWRWRPGRSLVTTGMNGE